MKSFVILAFYLISTTILASALPAGFHGIYKQVDNCVCVKGVNGNCTLPESAATALILNTISSKKNLETYESAEDVVVGGVKKSLPTRVFSDNGWNKKFKVRLGDDLLYTLNESNDGLSTEVKIDNLTFNQDEYALALDVPKTSRVQNNSELIEIISIVLPSFVNVTYTNWGTTGLSTAGPHRPGSKIGGSMVKNNFAIKYKTADTIYLEMINTNSNNYFFKVGCYLKRVN